MLSGHLFYSTTQLKSCLALKWGCIWWIHICSCVVWPQSQMPVKLCGTKEPRAYAKYSLLLFHPEFCKQTLDAFSFFLFFFFFYFFACYSKLPCGLYNCCILKCAKSLSVCSTFSEMLPTQNVPFFHQTWRLAGRKYDVFSQKTSCNCPPVYHQLQSLIGFYFFDTRATKKWSLSWTLSLSPCFPYEMKKLFIWGCSSALLKHRCNQTSIQITGFASLLWLSPFKGDKGVYYQLSHSLLASRQLWKAGHTVAGY